MNWKRLLPTLMIVSVLMMTSCSRNEDDSPPTFMAITSVNIIDVESGSILGDRTILIESDRIVDIVPDNSYARSDRQQVIDGRGMYAIPGLWDMHIHMINDIYTPVPWDFHEVDTGGQEKRQIYMPIALAFGVTGTRELSGGLATIALRDDVKSGKLLGPHMVVGSPLLDGPNPIWPDSAHIKIDSPERAREVVDELHLQGFDFLKTYNFLSPESYRALHERAREVGMEVSGEIPIGISLWEAAELGHRSVEHLTGVEFACSAREAELRAGYVARIAALNADPSTEDALDIWNRSEWEPYESLDADRCARLFAHLAEHNTWVCPTLVVQRAISHADEPAIANNPNHRYLSKWDADTAAMVEEFDPEHRLRPLHDYRLKVINEIQRAGVGILAGSDTPGGFNLHEELAIFVDAGLTPFEALRTATINPALYLGRENELGSIAPGKIADILLLRANPLEDIRNTQKIESVIFQGHLLDRTTLDQMLDELEEDAKNWPD